MNTDGHRLKIPELRFPEFDGEWGENKLGDITEWKSGGTPSKDRPDFWGGDIPWISASSMHEYKIDRSEFNLTELGLKNGSRMTPKGSLLLLVRGSMLYNRIPFGVAQVDVAFNQDVKAIDAGTELNSFLLPWFQATEHLLLSMVSGTGIGAGKLETSELKSLKVALPSVPEQKKIAAFLSAVDRRIEGLEKKRDLLRQYKKGLMQKLFDQTLRFTDDNGQPFPDWQEKRLETITSWKSGGTPAKDNAAYWGGDIPWISASSMHDVNVVNSKFKLTPLGVNNGSRLAAKGTLLLLVRGSMLFKRVPICVASREVAFNQDVKAVDGGARMNGFLLYWFQAKENLLLSMVTGTGIGAGKLETSELKAFKILLPCPEEQERIENCLSALDRRGNWVETQVAETRGFKQGLLQKIFV